MIRYSFQISVYKVPAQYYLTEPALGGYTSLLKSTWLYLQSPCSLLHNDPALGGYTGWSFYEHKAISSPRLLQAWQPGTWGYIYGNPVFTSDWDEQHGFLQKVAILILKQVLSHHFVLLKTWGLQVLYYYRRNIFKFFVLSKTRLTRRHQSLWPCVYNPASSIIMN